MGFYKGDKGSRRGSQKGGSRRCLEWRPERLFTGVSGPFGPKIAKKTSQNWGRGSGGVKSAGVSQSVRETGRDKSQSVPSPENLFRTRDLELPIFEGSLPSCSPHSAGYTRTSVHPYFPVANKKTVRQRTPWGGGGGEGGGKPHE